MSGKKIYAVLIPALLAIAGIVVVQGFWLKNAWDSGKRAFEEKVHIALTKVAEDISNLTRAQLPATDLISQMSGNYYIVHLNQTIDANSLEFYLKREFEDINLITDFEYGIYDCYTDQMVYGNYITRESETREKVENQLPKYNDFIYYFGVRFPNKTKFIYSVWWLPLLLSSILLLSIFFILYALKELISQRKLSRMQKSFINNMTHEMKTPLSSLKISAEVLSKSHIISKDPRLSQYVQIMLDQSEHLNSQVNRVLEIASTQTANFRLKKEKLNAISEIAIIRELMIKRYNLRKEQISMNSGETKDIYADSFHFKNIIKNILDNAIKYSIGTIAVDIQIFSLAHTLVLQFSDKGIGIDQKDLENIGKQFFRVDQGDLHRVKGFGLGLHYVVNVCKAHKWEFRINSIKDIGTTVKIEIPYG